MTSAPSAMVPGVVTRAPTARVPCALAEDGPEDGAIGVDAGLGPGDHHAAADGLGDLEGGGAEPEGGADRASSSPPPRSRTLLRKRRGSQLADGGARHQRQAGAGGVVPGPLGRAVGLPVLLVGVRHLELGRGTVGSCDGTSATRWPSQSERSSSEVVSVPSGRVMATRPGPRWRARASSRSGSRRPVSTRPVSASTMPQRRSPSMPRASTGGLGQPLAAHRLHRVAPDLVDDQAGRGPVVHRPRMPQRCGPPTDGSPWIARRTADWGPATSSVRWPCAGVSTTVPSSGRRTWTGTRAPSGPACWTCR